MEKNTLTEIKKGQTGTGLLIEHEGYISSDCGDNKKLFEDINSRIGTDEPICPEHFIVSAVFQKFGIENANGRIYPEHVLKREVEKYMEKIAGNKFGEKRAIGECNHPDDTVINLSRVAMNIIELHWVGHTLVGKLEVLTSPGFRKYGIISCEGDQIANLLLQGIKIGVSSRGMGTVTNKMGVLYVGDDYEIVCWDFVSEPSTPLAYVSDNDEVIQSYVEGKENKKPQLTENITKIDKALEILKDF